VFLRAGAAGASGTVDEPYALQCKFPLPSLQLHYARGASLAEAFYQSVSCPYQLLVVGDPLCQPWAVAPTVTVKGIKPNETVKGTISITPGGTGKGLKPLGAVEVFIDGRLVARGAPGNTLDINTAGFSDGYHELRVVGVDADAIEFQGRQIIPIRVRNHEAELEFRAAAVRVKFLEKLRVSVKQTGAKSIVIRQNQREVGRVQGEAGEVEIDATKLGRGPVMLSAVSEGEQPAQSAPLAVLVE
jgi:hypothetical protein